MTLALVLKIEYLALVLEIEYLRTARDLVWWTLLGVASSIGVGTSLVPTGPLYLYPMIARHASRYPAEPALAFWEVIARTVCWGAGTAIGEVPPYLASTVNKELLPPKMCCVRQMRVVLSKLGSLGILILASFPNTLFDLCGILAGQTMQSENPRDRITLTRFFLPTLVGKALILAPAKAYAMILFSDTVDVPWWEGIAWLQRPLSLGFAFWFFYTLVRSLADDELTLLQDEILTKGVRVVSRSLDEAIASTQSAAKSLQAQVRDNQKVD